MITPNVIATTFVDFFKTIINAVSKLWSFISSPIYEFEIRSGSVLGNILEHITNGAFEPGNYSITFFWFFTSTAIVLLIVLKLITLINPVG